MNEQIEQWKKQFGKVWSVKIAGIDYIYRGLTYTEFETLRNQERVTIAKLRQEGMDDDEISQQTISESMKAVVTTCVLSPEDYKTDMGKYPAGVVEALQPLILTASGFPTDEAPEPQEL